MKKIIAISLIAISGFGSLALTNKTSQKIETINQWLINDLVEKWENNKSYTITVMKKMPEEYFDFKPNDDVRSFKGHFKHIAEGFNFQLSQTVDFKLPKIKDDNKENFIDSYEVLFDELIKYIKRTDANSLNTSSKAWYGKTTKLRVFNLMDHHLAHHRAQAIVYMRLKNIKPPSYIGW